MPDSTIPLTPLPHPSAGRLYTFEVTCPASVAYELTAYDRDLYVAEVGFDQFTVTLEIAGTLEDFKFLRSKSFELEDTQDLVERLWLAANDRELARVFLKKCTSTTDDYTPLKEHDG